MKVWVYNFAYPVTALGPGRRVALWVSGCGRRCRGCITPQLWRREAGVPRTTEAVARRLLDIRQPLDGITVTGGEPFEQAAAMAELLEQLGVERPHWSVMVYSGHTLAHLRRQGASERAVLERTDVLIAGAYRPDRPPRHPLAGSGNQRIHLLSERGRQMRTLLGKPPKATANLGLSQDGHDWLIGVMDAPVRADLSAALQVHAPASRANPRSTESLPCIT